MPQITELKPQKNKKRVNVYVDGKFSFGIDLDSLVKFQVKVGVQYTQKELDKLIKKSEFQKTYEKLIRFASLRPRSEKEIDTWLSQKKVHKSLFQTLKSRLIKLELINDKKFAEWWIDQRIAFRPKGKRALISELRIKGVSKDIIQNTLSVKNVEEGKLAAHLLSKKWRQWDNMDLEKKKSKAYRFLQTRGFEWDVVKKTVDKLLEAETGVEEID